MRLTVRKEIQFETSVETDEILRRFPKEWKEYSKEMDLEEDISLLDKWDYEEFLINLGTDYGWDRVFGNEWFENLFEINIL